MVCCAGGQGGSSRVGTRGTCEGRDGYAATIIAVQILTFRMQRGQLQSQPAFPSEFPFDAPTLALDAGDELADAFFENGLPGYQPEAQSVLDHGEASARKRGGTGETAADVFAGFAG